MSDQSKLGIGKIITTEQGKDAIHVAVAPVTAACRLQPGDHVGLDSAGLASDDSDGNDIGVVDPFLIYPVKKGERFWLFLYPGSITSLAHVWTHPSFPETERATGAIPAQEKPSEKEISEQWLRNLAETVGVTYRQLMAGAASWVESKRSKAEWPEYLIRGSLMEGESTPESFWEHYERVSGDRISEDCRGSFFSCSC